MTTSETRAKAMTELRKQMVAAEAARGKRPTKAAWAGRLRPEMLGRPA